jgi:hypothetical protein
MGSDIINGNDYIRVRTSYYKVVLKRMLNGQQVRTLIPWNLATINRDMGKDFAATIPHYDDFVTVPEHINYRRVIDGRFYNLYEPLPYTPLPGEWSNIEQMLRHVFEEQYELILDYIEKAYFSPLQKLPIILLVSKDRGTGKSTFLNFIYAIFGVNATFNTNSDLTSQFNADWAGKLFILVDEVLLNKRESTERLKNLSTAQAFKMEAKGQDRVQQDFFGKFILCSNNVDRPLIIDPEETRFWVRDVKPLRTDNTNMLQDAIHEIPAFLYFLRNRTFSTVNCSRMFFDPQLLATPALLRIKMNCRNPLEAAIYEICKDILSLAEGKEYAFVSGDLLAILLQQGVKADDVAIRHILKDNWHLVPRATPSTYVKYSYCPSAASPYSSMPGKGRYYTVNDEFLQHIYNIVDL